MNSRRTNPAPTILSQLADAANLCTLAGLVSTVWGLAGALDGSLHQAAVGLMGSTVCDVADGYIARATPKRAELTSRIGGALDSLVDLAAGGILGAVCLLTLGEGSLFAVAVAMVTACALAGRLAYFTMVGLDGRYFVGVPVVVNQYLVAGLLLIVPLRHEPWGQYVLGMAMLAVAAANLSSWRVRKPGPRGMAGLAVFAVFIALGHIVQWQGAA